MYVHTVQDLFALFRVGLKQITGLIFFFFDVKATSKVQPVINFWQICAIILTSAKKT